MPVQNRQGLVYHVCIARCAWFRGPGEFDFDSFFVHTYMVVGKEPFVSGNPGGEKGACIGGKGRMSR